MLETVGPGARNAGGPPALVFGPHRQPSTRRTPCDRNAERRQYLERHEVESEPLYRLPPNTRPSAGRTVPFILPSPDVIHSFLVPPFIFKRDVIPGRINQFEVTITKPGTFVGHCAELCGIDHDRMSFSVRTVSDQEYRSYLDRMRVQGAGLQAAVPAGAPAP